MDLFRGLLDGLKMLNPTTLPDRRQRVTAAPTLSKHKGATKTPRYMRRVKNRRKTVLQKASRKANRRG